MGKFQIKVQKWEPKNLLGKPHWRPVLILFLPYMKPSALCHIVLFFPACVSSFPSPCVLAAPTLIISPSVTKWEVVVVPGLVVNNVSALRAANSGVSWDVAKASSSLDSWEVIP